VAPTQPRRLTSVVDAAAAAAAAVAADALVQS